MYTSLTIDHRIVDGETAGRFQTAIGELLADPSRLL
jgi:pyruvate/2-oxoglutarate dehydrogenase complex dihydrolipoamide acyltransferase (E2) component